MAVLWNSMLIVGKRKILLNILEARNQSPSTRKLPFSGQDIENYSGNG